MARCNATDTVYARSTRTTTYSSLSCGFIRLSSQPVYKQLSNYVWCHLEHPVDSTASIATTNARLAAKPSLCALDALLVSSRQAGAYCGAQQAWSIRGAPEQSLQTLTPFSSRTGAPSLFMQLSGSFLSLRSPCTAVCVHIGL